MDTFAIQSCLRKIAKSYANENKRKLYYRVCACDKLPKTIPYDQDVIIVINNQTSDQSGQHWYYLTYFH